MTDEDLLAVEAEALPFLTAVNHEFDTAEHAKAVLAVLFEVKAERDAKRKARE